MRIDAGVVEGGAVSVHYDPMLAKLIVHAEDRAHCLARTREALARFEILGVRTNLGFLQTLIAHPTFVAGQIDTGFLDRQLAELTTADAPVPPELIAAAAWHASLGGGPAADTPAAASALTDPFDTIRGWRG